MYQTDLLLLPYYIVLNWVVEIWGLFRVEQHQPGDAQVQLMAVPLLLNGYQQHIITQN